MAIHRTAGTVLLAAAATLAAVAPSTARDRTDRRPVAIVEPSYEAPRVRYVDVEPERIPIVSGRATATIIDDIRPTSSVRFRPKQTFVYVSTDPYDHVH